MIKIQDVFTPASAAKKNYIHRDNLVRDFNRHMQATGKQIVVFGDSGSGKTTLIFNELKHLKRLYIRTQCETITTYEDLLKQAFDAAEEYFTDRHNSQEVVSFGLGYEQASLSGGYTEVEEKRRIVTPQITTQRLASLFGKRGYVWVIEDFHKMAENEKQRVADALKIFIDESNVYPSVKIICIGAVNSPRELMKLDTNLQNRVADLYVPLLTNDEIEKIVKNGFKLLNIMIEDDLPKEIRYYSNNIGAVAHQLCYNICSENKIEKKTFLQQLVKTETLKGALKSYVDENTDKYSAIYDEIKNEYKFGFELLKLFNTDASRALKTDYIKRKLSKYSQNFNISEYLLNLTSVEYDYMLRYDSNTKSFSISDAFFHVFLRIKIASENEKNLNDAEILKTFLEVLFKHLESNLLQVKETNTTEKKIPKTNFLHFLKKIKSRFVKAFNISKSLK